MGTEVSWSFNVSKLCLQESILTERSSFLTSHVRGAAIEEKLNELSVMAYKSQETPNL